MRASFYEQELDVWGLFAVVYLASCVAMSPSRLSRWSMLTRYCTEFGCDHQSLSHWNRMIGGVHCLTSGFWTALQLQGWMGGAKKGENMRRRPAGIAMAHECVRNSVG